MQAGLAEVPKADVHLISADPREAPFRVEF